ncbi:hypothetical protein LCGC14_1975380, partial [marine sediment metagenome]
MPLLPEAKNCDVSVRKNFRKISRVLGYTGTPSFVGLTLTDLTTSRLVWTDANKLLASKDLVDLVAGTANEINIADDGSGGITIGIVDPLIVAKGGTGVATLTDGGLMLGSGTGAVTSLAQATNGQLPIGYTGADPTLATLTGTTDHINVTNGTGSITLDLDTNTKTLLGSFNGIFLEKLDFTISEAGGTVTGSLEQDSGGDLVQRFSDGYTVLDCTPALTINLTAYVGSNAVPKKVFVYILQSAKTAMAASNSGWPATEHIRVANLLLKSAATTGTDGGALANRNWNDFASDTNSQGHITHIENRIRQEPTQWNSGVALTLKNSAGAELTTGNSSTAVEIVTTTGTAYQLHKHTFPAFDMYSVGTDDAHVVNQPTDRGGAYETTANLVADITHYVDGTAAGVAIGTNKYFNLVLWGVQNRSGEPSHIMINLPTSQYTISANAVSDIDGTSVFNIPALFKGLGFLIARLTFRLIAGAQWTYIAQEDLRGQIPPISAGVGVTTTDHALLANLIAPADDHTQYILADGTRALAGAWNMGSQILTNVNIDSGDIHNDVTHTQWDAAYSHSLLSSGNPHSVTPTELSLVIGTNTQAWGLILDDFNTLTPPASDGQFIVATGAGAFAYESGTTVRTSIGLGTGDSPTWAGATITGGCVLGLNSSIFQPAAGGDSTTFFQVLDADGGTPILNVDTVNERVGIGTATIPHGGVGYAKLAIDGTSSNAAGPHV